MSTGEVRSALERVAPAGTDRTLLELSMESPLLVVFLRHFGCTFCREALADLGEEYARISAGGVNLVLVHMSSEESAERKAQSYGLQNALWVSDPQKQLYEAFGLGRGNLWQLFSPKVWLRGVEAGLLNGHAVGMLEGDGFQMPGAFLVKEGRITQSFTHESASDRPDYCQLAELS